MQQIIIGIAAGLATGIISGLVGIGGGVLLVPILLYVFRADMHTAAGTSLAIIIPTALSGAISHFSRGSVDLRLALLLTVGAIAGALVGTWLGHALPAVTLKRIFSVILLIVSFTILLDSYGIGVGKFLGRGDSPAQQVSVAHDGPGGGKVRAGGHVPARPGTTRPE